MGTAPVLPLLRGGGGESGRGRRTRNGWVVGWLAQRAGGHEEENFPLVVFLATEQRRERLPNHPSWPWIDRPFTSNSSSKEKKKHVSTVHQWAHQQQQQQLET